MQRAMCNSIETVEIKLVPQDTSILMPLRPALSSIFRYVIETLQIKLSCVICYMSRE